MKKSNHSILVSTIIFFIIFMGMIVYLVFFNTVKSEKIINNPYNKRQNVLAKKVIRGSIYSSDKKILAYTKVNDDKSETRIYPYSNVFSHVVGYTGNGGLGLEKLSAYYMLQSDQNFFDKIGNDLSGNRNLGNNVITTLDATLQQKAYEALGNNRGAVVVMEVKTGRVLAMVSKPDFDPNTVSFEWSEIIKPGNDSILVNRATSGLYPPGSTFKLVTMLEFIRENENPEEYHFVCEGGYDVEGTRINCMQKNPHGSLDLTDSLARSCNSSFINIGLSLDVKSFKKTAQELLFNTNLPIGLEHNNSKFMLNEASSKWDIAQTSFGQGKTVITPFHLCLISCAIANSGVLMEPVFIDKIENCNGITVKNFIPKEYRKIMSKEETDYLKKGMEQVFYQSFYGLFADAGYTIALKSGTAQYGTKGYEHSLMTSFSPVDNPEIAVAVVVEGGPQKDRVSAEVAKAVYDLYYSLEEKYH